jgi:glycosyltransferase involved in cell wall biosynthesis
LTLSKNRLLFDNITVVTSPDDLMCKKICDKYGVNCVITNRMYEDGAIFNKGKAINEGIKSIVNPDYILLIDADIIIEKEIDLNLLCEDTFYSMDRIILPDYVSYLKYEESRYLDGIRRDEENGYGYFQLFNYKEKQSYPEISNDAAWSDLIFRDKFIKRKKIDGYVIHLGLDCMNWKGRVTDRFLTDDDFTNLYMKKSTYKICSYYFNYRGDIRQKNNFLIFLNQFKDYYDNMIVGLVDYGDGDLDFDVPCEKIIIDGDKDNKLWSKEIIINKIIDNVDTDYLIWIDGDLIYESLDWLDNIDSVIGGNDFIQLFENINYLDGHNEILETHKSIVSVNPNSKNIDNLLGIGYKPGGSWLGKVSILKEKKFFEKMYVGGGDTIFMYGLYNIDNGFTLSKVGESNEKIKNGAVEWINRFGKYKVGYLSENISHLYHGDLKDRNYNDRYKILNHFLSNNIKLVSVIIVNYNCVTLLERAIDSVLNQTYKNIELIVLDNGSTDGSILIFDKYRNIKNVNIFLNPKNLGPYWAKNSIIDKINGDYITMLDSDDIDFPDKIEKQIIKFDDKTMMVSCSYQRENESPSFGYPSMMWKKDVFKKIGYYDSIKFGADSEFFDRFIKIYGKKSHLHINDVLQTGPRRIEGLTGIFPEKSEIRKNYILNYKNWHNIDENLYIDFPLFKRKFEIPKEMVIKEDIPYFEIKKLENENDILPVIMCTWKRVDGFKKIVSQLNKQTFKRFKLFVWNNNIEIKSEFEDILKFAEFEYEIFHSVDNIGGFGRFYYAGRIRRKPGFMDYCVFIDDDQTFGNDLLNVFYSEREYNTIKSQWGWKFSGLNYYSDRILVSVGEEIHYAGTGGMIADMRVFEDSELFLCREEYWYVEDLWLSYFSNKKHGYRLVKSGAVMKNGDDEHSLYRRVKDIKTPMLKYLINDEKWDLKNK